MTPAVDPVWETRSDSLHFQFGPFMLGEVPFRALVLVSNPFVVDPGLEVPLNDAVTKGCRGVINHGMPVSRNFPTVSLEHGGLRYATRYGERYVVDLDRSFAEYLKKFSAGTRGRLSRTVKAFVRANDGVADLREYRAPSEMIAFRDIAIEVSRRSYKRETDLGFQEGESFARQLEADAAVGRVRGYVLMFHGEPAAYRFCRIDHDVIVDKHTGYDEKFVKLSPGTVLLYMILERLFRQGEFRILDFDGLEYYAYKEFFSTRAVHCARVVWFQPRVREIALVGAHWTLTAAWRIASALRHYIGQDRRGWVSARAQLRRPRR